MNIVGLIALIVAILNMFLGFFVWLRGKKNMINIFFAGFAITTSIYVLSIHSAIIFSHKLFFGRLAFAAAAITMMFLLSFVYSFPEKRSISFKRLFVFIFFPIIFSVLSFTAFIVKNIEINGYYMTGVFGSALYFYRYFAIIYVLSIIAILLKKFIRSRDLTKLQLKYVLFGIGLFISSSLITNVILPGFFQIRQFNYLGPLFSVFMIIFISYAIVKHRLMDIKVVFQLGIIYSTILGIIVGLYFFIIFLISLIFQETSKQSVFLAGIFTTLIGIYSVPIIEKFFRHVTDKIFFKDKYDYSAAVYRLSEILTKNIRLNNLLAECTDALEDILKVGKVEVFLPESNIIFQLIKNNSVSEHKLPASMLEQIRLDDSLRVILYEEGAFHSYSSETESDSDIILSMALEYCKKYEIQVAVLIGIDEKLISIIGLGAKKSGEMFTEEDIKLLKTFSYQAAVAMENAQLYDEVKRHSENLERKVELRTIEIKNMQEEQKQMMLEIAHGLQTPLTIMKAELSNIEKIVANSKSIKSLERSIGRISNFIYDMLKLANLESKKREYGKEGVNLSDLFCELAESFEIIAKEKGIVIFHDIKPDVIILGDKKEMEDLITNLVSNSMKYLGGKTEKFISLKLDSIDRKAQMIIEDNGIGIEPEYLPHLFTKFYRGKDKYGNNSVKGTGLGLAICKEIVDRHNGEIKIESKPEEWTRATINLPLID
jgi:signal transduction histidine kinase